VLADPRLELTGRVVMIRAGNSPLNSTVRLGCVEARS